MAAIMERQDTGKELFEKEALQYLDELFASAMRMTRQKEAAEDLLSEVYTKAWKSFKQFQPGTNLRAWLYKILTNTYINHYRHNQRQPLMVELDRPVGPGYRETAAIFTTVSSARARAHLRIRIWRWLTASWIKI